MPFKPAIQHDAPMELPMGNLATWARGNWQIYSTLRADAQVAYATECADREVPGHVIGPDIPYDSATSDAWVNAFDRAAEHWAKVNPMHRIWSGGHWPRNAAAIPGDDALETARAAMRRWLRHEG